MQVSKKWYALYTRPHFEKKVAGLLSRKQLDSYCPVLKVTKKWADRKKIIFEPLFKSYVFVRLADTEFVQALQTDGIIRFVHWLGRPAVIRDEEITAIQAFLAEHPQVSLERIEVNLNDSVRIINGPFRELEGEVQEIRNRTVRIYLPSLGYMMMAEVEKSNIELISPKDLTKTKKAS